MFKYVTCIFFTLICKSAQFSIEVRYNTTKYIQSPLVERNGVDSGLNGVKYLPDSYQPSLFGYKITSSDSKLVFFNLFYKVFMLSVFFFPLR